MKKVVMVNQIIICTVALQQCKSLKTGKTFCLSIFFQTICVELKFLMRNAPFFRTARCLKLIIKSLSA